MIAENIDIFTDRQAIKNVIIFHFFEIMQHVFFKKFKKIDGWSISLKYN